MFVHKPINESSSQLKLEHNAMNVEDVTNDPIETTMDRWLAKLISLFAIFVAVFASTILPIQVYCVFSRYGSRGVHFISCLMYFGRGVFLGVYMLHMAPDVRNIFDEALFHPRRITYPVADCVMVGGFFLMVFLQSVIKHLQDKKSVIEEVNSNHHFRSPLISYSSSDSASAAGIPAQLDHRHSVFGYELCGGERVLLKNNSIEVDQPTTEFINKAKSTTAGREFTHIELAVEKLNVLNDHGQAHADMTRSMSLLCALSLHNMFEGLSIGLKQTTSSVVNLSIAVVAHEVVIGFCLGMQMVRTYKSVRKIVLAAAMVSSMVPLGLVIGLFVTETGQLRPTVASLVINGIMQGLATGVFIYVTFIEILRGELGHGREGIDKMLLMCFGFVVLALLALVPDDALTKLHGPDSDYQLQLEHLNAITSLALGTTRGFNDSIGLHEELQILNCSGLIVT